MRYFKTIEGFFNPTHKTKPVKKKKVLKKIENAVDAELSNQAATKTLDDIAYRGSQAHGLNHPAGNPDFK